MEPGKRAMAASRIVVVMPNWLGDGVMATPFLRGLRRIYPEARIAAVARPLVAAVCRGVSFVDEVKACARGEEGAVSRWMRGERFELGILLPNSFRSAWMLWRGGVRRRLGYARGGRSLLLTDRLKPLKKDHAQWCRDEAVRNAIRLLKFEEPIADGDLLRVHVTGRMETVFAEHRMRSSGKVVRAPACIYHGRYEGPDQEAAILAAKFQPVPTIDYYLELARYLEGDAAGAEKLLDRRMELAVTAEERAEAEGALGELGIGDAEPLVVIVPGANFGWAKCWLPERFTAVAEKLAEPGGVFGARVALAGSLAEKPVLDAILDKVNPESRSRIQSLAAVNGGQGISVGALKEIVRRSGLMICNDTGPRHFAAAFGVPVVTLFGPTDPLWAETFFEKERKVRIEVPCGPCQLKSCPIDHRCMKGITVERVMAAATELWRK